MKHTQYMQRNAKSQAANGKTVRIGNLTAAIRPVCALNRLLLAILPRWALADAAVGRLKAAGIAAGRDAATTLLRTLVQLVYAVVRVAE